MGLMEISTLRAIEAQKRRAIAEILEAKDQIADPYLSSDDSRRLRKAILDAVNDLHRNTLLIVEAAEEGMTVNELIIDRLAEIR